MPNDRQKEAQTYQTGGFLYDNLAILSTSQAGFLAVLRHHLDFDAPLPVLTQLLITPHLKLLLDFQHGNLYLLW